MAHFAEIDALQRVIRVLVVDDVDTQDKKGNEVDSIGMKYLNDAFSGTWVQTSYNNNFRKNYAGSGYTYDSARDAFIAPKPFASWTLVEDTCQWTAPVAYPDDGKTYTWNEATTAWKETT